MNHLELRNSLTTALSRLYEMEAFSCLAEFLQGELNVLYHLSQSGKSEVNPSILSDKLRVSRSRITAALSSLRRKGYVRMEISEEDRRRMRVILTPEGASFFRKKQIQVEDYFDMLVKGMGEKDVKELIRLINRSIELVGKEPEGNSDSCVEGNRRG
ncbi:MAG: MarR family winged helix-turn-helix transcriptional regulator [Bacillota bacterium]|jgi:DNA-binding MarR family transcriptional regulator